MENVYIYKELKAEFLKYCNERNLLSEIKAQRASWKFGIYPSTSQIFEVHSCDSQINCSHNIKFHEYCLLIAAIKSDLYRSGGKTKLKLTRSLSNLKTRWDVFLGGACNPTTWRFDVAIPFLKEKNITFYNPQVSQWDPSLIAIEEKAKETAKVQFFVLDIYRTRGIASLVEAAYLSGQGRNLVLVVPAERPATIKEVDVKEIDETEFQSINRSYLFIADLVQRQGIPLFTSVNEALKATRVSLITNSMVQDLTEIDGVIPVKHAYVNVSTVVRTLEKIFSDHDSSKSGVITLSDVRTGLSKVFGCDIDPISTMKETFTFPEFCIECSILLLNSIIRRQEATRSHSVDFFNKRPTSLENIFISGKAQNLKSALNIKEQMFSHEEGEFKLSSDENARIKKNLKSNHYNNNKKISACLNKLKKWPFSRISTINSENIVTQISSLPVLSVHRPMEDADKYDIFLGGTCGNSDWREKIAIPILTEAGCKYFDPKVSNDKWSRRQLPVEALARECSKVLVYVITSECTSTAALVEAAHFIGQGKKIFLHVQLLSNTCSPPLTPMGQLLQSSCSFPFSSINNNLKSEFSVHHEDSITTGYHSNSEASESCPLSASSQFSLPLFSNKLSLSDSGHLGSVDDISNLSMSFNNISKINPLPSVACKDHNRGRKYLIDLASRAKVPILHSVAETIQQAIKWCQIQDQS